MNSTGQLTLSCVQTVRWLTKTPGCIDRANKWRCENESVYFSMFFSCHAQFIICHKWWGVGGGGGGLLSTRTSGNLSLKELNLKRYNEYPNGTGETNWVFGGTYVAPFCYSNNIFLHLHGGLARKWPLEFTCFPCDKWTIRCRTWVYWELRNIRTGENVTVLLWSGKSVKIIVSIAF